MKVVRNESAFRLPASVASIGMFDGVHRGHRRVLQQLRALGQQHGVPTVVVTFDPHPRALLRPESAPLLLTVLEDRLQLLRMTGAVDYCLVLPFDAQRAAQTAEGFVAETLVERLAIRALVVGANFRCGSGRRGDVPLLATLGQAHDYLVHPVALNDAPDNRAVHCSSTEVRRLIQAGDLAAAALMLGRPHGVRGTVSVRHRGPERAVDVLVPAGICMPADGEYAGAVGRAGASAAWMEAALRVKAGQSGSRRSLRLQVSRDLPLASGDHVQVRFLTQAAEAGRRFALTAA